MAEDASLGLLDLKARQVGDVQRPPLRKGSLMAQTSGTLQPVSGPGPESSECAALLWDGPEPLTNVEGRPGGPSGRSGTATAV